MEKLTVNRQNINQFKVFLIKAKAAFDILKVINQKIPEGSPQLRLMELNELTLRECEKDAPDFDIINKHVGDIMEMGEYFTPPPSFKPGGIISGTGEGGEYIVPPFTGI